MSNIEHDTLEDAPDSKLGKSPPEPKEPGLLELKREAMRIKADREADVWLHVGNPEIWTSLDRR